jgi:hypothetical protein
MSPRQARRERREAERKAKKLALKKSRLAENQLSPTLNDLPDIQPRSNPELQDELPPKNSCDDAARDAGRDEIPSRPSQLATSSTEIRHNVIADRASLQAGLPLPPPGPAPSFQHRLARKEFGFVSQRRTAASRTNSKLSTGPRTEDGKLASSRNSTKHGLASGTLIIPGEDPTAFEMLLDDLLEEHQPASPTERLLIEEMAQSYRLTQRALRLENTCFTNEGVNEKQLALFLRYQTTHERRFYKALNCLLQIKKEAVRNHRGFVSQPSRSATPEIGFVSQADPPTPLPPQCVRLKADTYSVEAS